MANGDGHSLACEFDQVHGYECTCGVLIMERMDAIHAKIAAWAGDAALGDGLLREIYDLSDTSGLGAAWGTRIRDAESERDAARERILELEDRCAELAERYGGLRP